MASFDEIQYLRAGLAKENPENPTDRGNSPPSPAYTPKANSKFSTRGPRSRINHTTSTPLDLKTVEGKQIFQEYMTRVCELERLCKSKLEKDIHEVRETSWQQYLQWNEAVFLAAKTRASYSRHPRLSFSWFNTIEGRPLKALFTRETWKTGWERADKIAEIKRLSKIEFASQMKGLRAEYDGLINDRILRRHL